jgi:allophanate hydrolase
VVPACRSLDCVSIFTRTVPEAELALRCLAEQPPNPVPASPYRIGIPAPSALGTLAPGWAEAFQAAIARFPGAELVPIDVTPFLQAARLLYSGAFVAERYSAVGRFIDDHPDDVDPTVAAIISAARDIPAHQLYTDQEELEKLAGLASLTDVDALLLPTTTRHPTIAEVAADPIGVNSELGRFTNFANLLGLAVLAIPAGTVNGLPFGVSLIGPAFTDTTLMTIARSAARRQRIAVVGAHLTGQPLSFELVIRGGRLVESTKTAPAYRLFALDTTPPKPGLVRAPGGSAIQTEVWDLPTEGFGDFVASLPTPMAIGTVELADGTWVPGFTCEQYALRNATDITGHGGWRPYLVSTFASRDKPTGHDLAE